MSALTYIVVNTASFVFVYLYFISMMVMVVLILDGLGISGDGLSYKRTLLYSWITLFISAVLTSLTIAPIIIGLGIVNDGFIMALVFYVGSSTFLPAVELFCALEGNSLVRSRMLSQDTKK
jgi:hypothetical protein